MKDALFSPGEIRDMLDISRSALRYYIQKGLLDVDKNDANGYHTFSQNNITDLRDISYLRSMLDFSVTEIKSCFSASTPDEYESVFLEKKERLGQEIAQKKLQYERLSRWAEYLAHLKGMPDTFDVVEFPEPFVFTPTVSVSLEKLSLMSSSFSLDKDGVPTFSGYGYCHNEPSGYDIASSPGNIRFPGGKYIYSMCSSEEAMDDPSILITTLRWASDHGYQIRGPIQVNYFYRIKKNGIQRNYYDITVPFADCPIQIG